MSSEIASNSSEPPLENGEEKDGSLSEDGSISSEKDKGGKASSDTKNSKVCGVCGDKALGNNFNAITCESCKAFFRRNAARSFVCPFSNNCKVDAITRRFCQRCRLKKCFDIGMKKEWIMTDDEKRLKKQKIEQNRLKRSSLENSARSGDDSDGPASKIPKPIGSPGDEGEVNGDISPQENAKVIGKQPMGPHNSNKQSARTMADRNNRITVNIVAISSNSQPSVEELPGQHVSSNDDAGFSSLPSQSATTAQQIQHQEDDSLSSNSSSDMIIQSPQLVKYPLNKRLKPLKKESDIDTGPTPLLSSLIDNSSSPPDPRIQSDNASSGVEVNMKNEGVIVLPQSDTSAVSSTQITAILPDSPPILAYHDDTISHHSQPPHHHTPPAIVAPRYELHDNHNHNHYHQYTSDPGNHAFPMEASGRKHIYAESSFAHYPNSDHRSNHDLIPMPPVNLDSILSVAIAAEFNAFGMLGANSSRELNKAEQNKLNELLLASQHFHAPVDAERDIKVSETSDPSLLNVINLTEIAIRRLIKMSKKISAFRTLCQEDQIALLKAGCTEMMILRSVVTYDPLKDSWEIPHSNPGQYNIQLGVLKEARGNLYEEHQRFVKSFRSEWRKDENIMIILCAITLFTPERLNVVHKDVVKLEQDSYYYLLKRYLESILNGCEAKSTYLQLIKKIAELRALNSSHVRVFLEMNPKEVEPLLIEIFDLK